MMGMRNLIGKTKNGVVARWHIVNDPVMGQTWCGRKLKGITIFGLVAERMLAEGEGVVCPDCERAQTNDQPVSWRKR